MATTCLYTTIRCEVTGGAWFGFLPPFGMQLADDEEVTVAGDLTNRIALRRDFQRAFPAYEAALTDEELVLVNTPAVVLYDATEDESVLLAVDGETLGTNTPCWLEA